MFVLSHLPLAHFFQFLPDIWLTLSAPLSFGLAKAYANHLWSVTEPEAVGMPGWQTGAKALCLYSQSLQACKPVRRAPTPCSTTFGTDEPITDAFSSLGGQVLATKNGPLDHFDP